jgi:hypothetical protein
LIPERDSVGSKIAQTMLLVSVLLLMLSDIRYTNSQTESSTQNNTYKVKPTEVQTIISENFKLNPANSSVASNFVRNSPYDVTNVSGAFSKSVIVGNSSTQLFISETTIPPPVIDTIAGIVRESTLQ